MMRSLGVPIEHLSLQRDFLTPLRRAAEIPEHFIGAGTTSGGMNYSRMASRCRMIFGEKVFPCHRTLYWREIYPDYGASH